MQQKFGMKFALDIMSMREGHEILYSSLKFVIPLKLFCRIHQSPSSYCAICDEQLQKSTFLQALRVAYSDLIC